MRTLITIGAVTGVVVLVVSLFFGMRKPPLSANRQEMLEAGARAYEQEQQKETASSGIEGSDRTMVNTDSHSISSSGLSGAITTSSGTGNTSQWRSMESAPRDGTWVELKNTYGVAPWYRLGRWTRERTSQDQTGEIVSYAAETPSWDFGDATGISDEEHLQWRPYSGDIKAYTDPTGGAQNSAAYWRGAVTKKYGLPLDYFEKDIQE